MGKTIYLAEYADHSLADNPSAYESLDDALDGFAVPADKRPASVDYMAVIAWVRDGEKYETEIVVRAVELEPPSTVERAYQTIIENTKEFDDGNDITD